MMGYLTEGMKSTFRLENKGHYKCSRCKRGKVVGNYISYQGRLTLAIDGQMAMRIFFACSEKGHLTFIGYNRPVNFNKNLPQYPVPDTSFEEEEREIEEEWKEMEENARKRRRVFYGTY